MRRRPTQGEFTRIMAVLEKARADRKEVTWNGTQAEGRQLCKSLTGYRPSKSNCLACELKVVDLLREMVNLPPISRPANEGVYEQRMAICETCAAYHPRTKSCGRLGVDALTPRPVLINGNEVNPCGCFLPLKATMKHAACPASLW